MSSNAKQILADIIDQKRTELDPELSAPDFFEIFCAEQILKDYELSYEEIEAGIVDGEHDGGVDSIFIMVDGEVVHEDSTVSDFKKPKEIELHIIQSKTSGGFSEDPINRLLSATKHLLNLESEFSELTQYNEDVRSWFDCFRSIYRGLAAKFPRLKINVYYAAQRADSNLHGNLEIKSAELKQQLKAMFDEASVEFRFLGAKELLSLARRTPNKSFELRVAKSLNGENGYVVLCKIGDYDNFLRDNGVTVRTDLFEANVRDYQGSTEVNSEIAQTLGGDSKIDFWWLNNGVTLLGSRAILNGSTVTIENPQIVNGLQTSSEIAAHFDSGGDKEDARMIMVKIVSSEDDETRDKIIKATNSQNSVPPASLRATDKVQRDIEHALKTVGLFYDRRKNYYKNAGKPAAKIVSIPLLAQALMTLLRGEPDNARARPSSLIKKDEVYSTLFTDEYPLDCYAVSATLMKRVEISLKRRSNFTSRDRNNLRFYVLFWVASVAAKSISLNAGKIAALKAVEITDTDLEAGIDEVSAIFDSLGGTDQVAKGPALKRSIAEVLEPKIRLMHTSTSV